MKWVAAAAAVCALTLAGPASGITYGQPDGDAHPEVGALVVTISTGTFAYCTGTLVSPTVLVTAAHCDDDGAAVQVTFDPVVGPASALVSGRFVADPLFGGGQGDAHDLAVVLFPEPVAGVAPARLPAESALDALKAMGELTGSTRFTVVGYGAEERSFDGKGQPQLTFPGLRRFAVSSFNSLNKGYLRLSQNQAHGDGGTCIGDSGGPTFLGAGAEETDVVAAVTVTGDAQCVSTSVAYRLDTPSARGFLGQFVALP